MRFYLGYPSVRTVPTPVGEVFTAAGVADARYKCVEILIRYNMDYGFLCIVRDDAVEMDCTVRQDGMFCHEVLIEGHTAEERPELFRDRWQKVRRPR